MGPGRGPVCAGRSPFARVLSPTDWRLDRNFQPGFTEPPMASFRAARPGRGETMSLHSTGPEHLTPFHQTITGFGSRRRSAVSV